MAVVMMSAAPMTAAPKENASASISLRVMTYNIHSCKGRDGLTRPDRIAEVIAAYHPDVVALQEVRVGHVDADRLDQPRAIAEALGMHHVFYPLVRNKLEDYGIAVLSRHPLTLVRAANLPTVEGKMFSEQRGAIWTSFVVDGVEIQMMSTHLGLYAKERVDQVETLLGPTWLGSEKLTGPFLLCGDLNSRPGQAPYKRLADVVMDAPAAAAGKKVKATWPSRNAFFRIDHIFVPRSTIVNATDVPSTELTKVASDHLPLMADITFPRAVVAGK